MGKKDMSLWIKEKVEQGIIERKAVHGAAPIFAQEKKDKIRMRPLVDLTARNEITIKDDETILNPRMILNSLGRARYRSKIDLSDAYFQTRVEPQDVDKNSFKSPFGCFVSKVMLQGDMNAPGTFMRIMSDLFADYLGQFMWVYIDNILIYCDTEQDHLKHIAIVTASWVVAGIDRVTILSLYQSVVCNETKYRRLRLSCCNKLLTISQLPSSS